MEREQIGLMTLNISGKPITMVYSTDPDAALKWAIKGLNYMIDSGVFTNLESLYSSLFSYDLTESGLGDGYDAKLLEEAEGLYEKALELSQKSDE